MSGLIDRDLAIMNVRDIHARSNFREYSALDEVMMMLYQMQDAEPEIPKCKDCYWWTKQSDSLQGRCDRYGFYPTGYWYCAAARERREEE